ncbi:L-ascorbate metabolism protein UlaG (beta-lactamase superfamily) [Pontibacter ummariensis]|uniref:L-ascorbate metabolism protein UlaG, beta-lactamase superfamily n=1 Tax=Pontibacter ummariensis TaxID=1610492 RepID=A0A239LK21_9BACT|nr:MBL fold metallo-hydrolase [Pontibacter ummariensis]PRY03129.1 L-ascorbate metabolism protein UlaG (beta-lactamase superfamily) [Pontibacter ummariensis]SNT30242.1 L-ascorbate metabolism protein UlaG, beta-lactamase superfamily [Pontibacter ummariensis]
MRPEFNFTWLGGPTFILDIGNFRLLSDPVFAEGPFAFMMNGHPSSGKDNVPIARATPLPSMDFSDLDLLLLSHLHSDHFDEVARDRLPKDLLLIAPVDQVDSPKLKNFTNRRPLGWWEVTLLEKQGETLRIISLPASHSHDPATNNDLGVVNGYALQYTSDQFTYTVYWTGDTVWFEGIREIKERLGKIDLLVPHLGAVGKGGPWGLMTLDSEEAAKVVDTVQPVTVIPVHHHTFSHYTEPISFLEERLQHSPTDLRVLQEGESFRLIVQGQVP